MTIGILRFVYIFIDKLEILPYLLYIDLAKFFIRKNVADMPEFLLMVREFKRGIIISVCMYRISFFNL